MIGNMSNVSFEYFADDGQFPNSPFPAVIYRQAVSADEASPEVIEALFDRNGWPSQWRGGVYGYHHYHSTAHECLGVARGTASLRLGGPEGRSFALEAGDVVVLPAGTAHSCETRSADFLVVGAYPPGPAWDLLRGDAADRPEADLRITRVPPPVADPVGGQNGPLLQHWV